MTLVKKMLRSVPGHKVYDFSIVICAILTIALFVMAGKSYIERPVAAAQQYLQSLEYEKQKWLLVQTVEKVKKVETKIEAINNVMNNVLVESKYQSALLGWILAGFGVIAVGALTIILRFSDKMFVNKEVKE